MKIGEIMKIRSKKNKKSMKERAKVSHLGLRMNFDQKKRNEN